MGSNLCWVINFSSCYLLIFIHSHFARRNNLRINWSIFVNVLRLFNEAFFLTLTKQKQLSSLRFDRRLDIIGVAALQWFNAVQTATDKRWNPIPALGILCNDVGRCHSLRNVCFECTHNHNPPLTSSFNNTDAISCRVSSEPPLTTNWAAAKTQRVARKTSFSPIVDSEVGLAGVWTLVCPPLSPSLLGSVRVRGWKWEVWGKKGEG